MKRANRNTDQKFESLIRSRRKALCLSLDQLAYRMGLQQSTVVRLEQSERRGRVTLESLRKAAKALNCKLELRLIPLESSVDNSEIEHLGEMTVFTKRSKIISSKRPSSQVADQLSAEQIELARGQTPSQRLNSLFQMSDFNVRMQRSLKPTT